MQLIGVQVVGQQLLLKKIFVCRPDAREREREREEFVLVPDGMPMG